MGLTQRLTGSWSNKLEEESTERRQYSRRRTLLSGKLVFNHCWGALDCTVRDLSESGAQIHVGEWAGLPIVLELWLGRGNRYLCETVRYGDRELGLRFVEMQQAA